MRVFFAILVILVSVSTANATCFCLKCLTGMYKQFEILSGSMSPTIITGDCITANYISSDINPPERGDVIYFRAPNYEQHIVKRVVGLAGDTVQMVDGVLILNGVSVNQVRVQDFEIEYKPEGPMGVLPNCRNHPEIGDTCYADQFTESLDNGRSYRVLDTRDWAYDNTQIVTVPAGHIFVMGDNRDNSVDSRFVPSNRGGLGFVPLENVFGIFDGY